MPTAKQSPDPWLTKAEAAKLLGVVIRQIERRARQGYIESRRLPREVNETTARVVYSRADILALKAGKPNVHAREVPATEPEGQGIVKAGAAALTPYIPPVEQTARLQHFLADVLRVYPVYRDKPWLTLDEASEYSGLPKSWLLKEARKRFAESFANGVFAINVGSDKREVWRFGRRAIGKLWELYT